MVYIYIWAHYVGPIVYIYGPTMKASYIFIYMGVYMGVYIWAHYGGPIVYMGVVFYK